MEIRFINFVLAIQQNRIPGKWQKSDPRRGTQNWIPWEWQSDTTDQRLRECLSARICTPLIREPLKFVSTHEKGQDDQPLVWPCWSFRRSARSRTPNHAHIWPYAPSFHPALAAVSKLRACSLSVDAQTLSADCKQKQAERYESIQRSKTRKPW